MCDIMEVDDAPILCAIRRHKERHSTVQVMVEGEGVQHQAAQKAHREEANASAVVEASDVLGLTALRQPRKEL